MLRSVMDVVLVLFPLHRLVINHWWKTCSWNRSYQFYHLNHFTSIYCIQGITQNLIPEISWGRIYPSQLSTVFPWIPWRHRFFADEIQVLAQLGSAGAAPARQLPKAEELENVTRRTRRNKMDMGWSSHLWSSQIYGCSEWYHFWNRPAVLRPRSIEVL